MKFERVFAFPTKDTFNCPPIGAFVKRYLKACNGGVSVDCFARNKRWATFTNDLNPNTQAEFHLDVKDFLIMLIEREVKADLVIYDPPFSPTQMKRSYEDIGRKMSGTDAWRTCGWTTEKGLAHQLLKLNGVFLMFGWNSHGLGSSGIGPYRTEEILLVCHGPGTPDTICLAERKVDEQLNLF